ncbi:MAG: FAD-dependent oxidoreductase [Bacteriovoracaceae bacterium]
MDISRTEKAYSYIARPKNKSEIISFIKFAKANNLKVTIKGTNHSHGGHNRRKDINGCPTAIQLDMAEYNHLISINSSKMEVTVESGMTWRELATKLDPYKLAVRTEQSSNIFSIGGSVSTNVHGRDVYGPLINSLIEIKYIDGDGIERKVGRNQRTQIFRAIVGGYGGLGIITEITLRVDKNYLYEAQSYKDISLKDYLNYLKTIEQKPANIMHYGRVNLTGETPFSKVQFVEWNPINDNEELSTWKGWKLDLNEKNEAISSALMNLMRNRKTSIWGKTIKEKLDEIFGLPKTGTHKTKNNILNNPVFFLFDNYYNKNQSVDILQEYFIPISQGENFLKKLQAIVDSNQVNLLNVTLRYIPKMGAYQDSILTPYLTKENTLAIVLYINIEDTSSGNGSLISYNGSSWTQKIIDAAQSVGGSFYWPYHRWWNKNQILKRDKENIINYFQIKDQIDPNNIFENDFLKALRQTIQN